MMVDKLIEKFYRQECSEEEKKTIINYFIENPKEIDDFFSEEEWNDFAFRASLDPDVSRRMKKVVFRHAKTKVRVISLIKRFAIAASILLVIGIGWKYFTVVTLPKGHFNNQNKIVFIDTTNKSVTKVNIELPDGSTVELTSGSRLKYQKPFEAQKRIVFLYGEAVFKVAKDSSKPFTVYSGEITTTALGTVFKVTSLQKDFDIKVKLYKGKVVIRSADSSRRKLNKDYYLSPGEEFYYNKKTLSAGIVNDANKTLSLKKNKLPDNDETSGTDNWYMFNNQNLSQVFENLKIIYKVKIEYNNEAITGMNFIGRIDKNDSIETILNDIAFLNGLIVTRKGNTYYIEKK